uniref:Uncharacterized protein n=1 Tax=Ciona savignyi TaxID=51511 RepID=H2ZQK2_CIOSA
MSWSVSSQDSPSNRQITAIWWFSLRYLKRPTSRLPQYIIEEIVITSMNPRFFEYQHIPNVSFHVNRAYSALLYCNIFIQHLYTMYIQANPTSQHGAFHGVLLTEVFVLLLPVSRFGYLL